MSTRPELTEGIKPSNDVSSITNSTPISSAINCARSASIPTTCASPPSRTTHSNGGKSALVPTTNSPAS